MADDTRDALAKVAREILAQRGFVGLTIKTAAAAAGVTPDVALRYYRNRDALLDAALRLPSDPVTALPTLVAPGLEGMGERLVRYMLDVLRDPQTRSELVALARTGVNAGHAAAGLQDFLERSVVDRMASMIGVPDARMRSALITSYLLGIAMTRYGARLEPLSSASEEEIVRMVAPVIQDLLDPRKPLPGSERARRASGGDGTAAPAGPPRSVRTFDPDPKATAARAAAAAQSDRARPVPARAAAAGTAAKAAPDAPTRSRTTGSAQARAAAGGAGGPRPSQESGAGSATGRDRQTGTSSRQGSPGHREARAPRAPRATDSGPKHAAGPKPAPGPDEGTPGSPDRG